MKKEITWILVLAFVSVVASTAINFFTAPSHPVYQFLGPSSTRNGLTLEIIETAPEGLDNPAIRNTMEIWRELFENAENTIDIEAPYISHYLDQTEHQREYNQLFDSLQSAAERGVRVRILTNFWPASLDRLTNNGNIQILNPPEENLDIHAKYLVVDEEKAFVGSQNWSIGGALINREVGVLIHDERLVGTYTYIFETGWAAAGGATRRENFWEAGWIYPVASGQQMPTEPKHTATALENLIDSAEQSVKVYLYVFSTGWAANPLARALVDAAERGVVVQLMFDARFYADFWPEGGDIDFSDRLVELKDVEGVFIKLINFGEWSAAHPKMVVVDGERAYVGSANWTSSSLVERREVGVIFEDRVLASALDEIFRTDWNSEYTQWVVEPNWLFGVVLTTGAIFGVLVMVLFATVHARRRKKKRERRKWIAELWASPRQEV